MARVFLMLWLAAFAVQTSDVLLLVAADGCTENVQDSAADPCADGCPRCVCCARVAAFLVQASSNVQAPQRVLTRAQAPLEPSTTPSPHGIYHVPKNS